MPLTASKSTRNALETSGVGGDDDDDGLVDRVVGALLGSGRRFDDELMSERPPGAATAWSCANSRGSIGRWVSSPASPPSRNSTICGLQRRGVRQSLLRPGPGTRRTALPPSLRWVRRFAWRAAMRRATAADGGGSEREIAVPARSHLPFGPPERSQPAKPRRDREDSLTTYRSTTPASLHRARRAARRPAPRPRRVRPARSLTWPVRHSGVHPRVCGEAEKLDPGEATVKGPSPRVRGSREPHRPPDFHDGSIPACAGLAVTY